MLSGGGALNVGLKKAFEDELLRDIYVANHPQFNGAIGAAYFAQMQLSISGKSGTDESINYS